MISAAIALLLSAQASGSGDLPRYTVTGSPATGLLFDVERFPATRSLDVDRMILAEAARRCGVETAHLSGYSIEQGKMTVDRKLVPAILHYTRGILCIEPVAPAKPAPPDFKPTADDWATAVAAFEKYYAAYDAEDADSVQRMSDSPQTPRDALLQEMRSFAAEWGRGKRVPYAISWVLNPDHPHPGVFAEVIYYLHLPRNKTICGAALFYRADAQSYLLSRNLMRPFETPAGGKANPCPPDGP